MIQTSFSSERLGAEVVTLPALYFPVILLNLEALLWKNKHFKSTFT